MDPATAMMMASMLSGGVGAAGSALSGNKGGKGGVGASVLYPKQYSFTEPRLKLISDFITEQMQSLREGEAPMWWTKREPGVRAGMQRGLKETFHGSPMGGRGVMGQVRAAGAATGAGPKSTTAQTNKAMLEYANKSKQIEEYLATLGVDISREGAKSFPYMGMQMPRGPESKVVGPYSTQEPAYQDPWAMMGGGMAAAAPWLMKQQMPQQPDVSAYPWMGAGSQQAGAQTPWYGQQSQPGSMFDDELARLVLTPTSSTIGGRR